MIDKAKLAEWRAMLSKQCDEDREWLRHHGLPELLDEVERLRCAEECICRSDRFSEKSCTDCGGPITIGPILNGPMVCEDCV